MAGPTERPIPNELIVILAEATEKDSKVIVGLEPAQNLTLQKIRRRDPDQSTLRAFLGAAICQAMCS